MGPHLVFLFLVSISFAWNCQGLEVTASRSTATEKNFVKPNTNSTHVLDVRTPPRIRIQEKKRPKPNIESSHPGVAIPLDANTIVSEETQTRDGPEFEKPVTEKTTSTWILLRGQVLSTTSKPRIDDNGNRKNITTSPPNQIQVTSTSEKQIESSTTQAEVLNNDNKTDIESTTNNSTETHIPSEDSEIPLEAKDASISLDDKKRKNSSKKKEKNKNRRKKPANRHGSNNSVKPIGNNNEQIGNQFYTYLSREIVPTLGVGLVGLVVTAGIASYFLFPVAPLRRSDELDTNKKNRNYFYRDKYSDGMPEEEAIGQVIAGMAGNLFAPKPAKIHPKNSLLNKTYRGSVSGSQHQNMQGSVETHNNMRDRSVLRNSQDKDEDGHVTHMAIPEHGPRSFMTHRGRRHRDLPLSGDGEI